MASQPIPMEPKYILDLIIKRRWIIIIPFFLAMLVGIGLAVTLPKMYQASTMILIQPQRVPKSYVQSIVSTDPSERISTLSQQVMSRTNLEKIINEFKMFSGVEYENMYMEDKIESLRERIAINVSRDRRGNDAFSITFRDQSRDVVTNVTNALASYFIDENLRLREAQAVGTSDFLKDELETMRKRLEGVEENLKKYRETYMGELPEQLGSNLSILDRLQEQLVERQQSLGEARIRLAALQNQIASTREQQVVVVNNGAVQENPTDLDQLKLRLESLRTRYTDRHPDIVRLVKQIEEQEEKAKTAAAKADAAPVQDATVSRPSAVPAAYRSQLIEINAEIQRLNDDIADLRTDIAKYKRRVENTPKREQELLSLRRDYQNIQQSYDSLLERKLEAEIAVNMERKQKGEQFRIIDPARRPEKPVSPNMKKLFLMVVAGSLALGGGIVFVLEYLDTSFKRPEDIESDLSIPVLCTIPKLLGKRQVLLQRLEYVSFLAFSLTSLVLFACFTVLTQKGVEQTLTFVKKFVNV